MIEGIALLIVLVVPGLAWRRAAGLRGEHLTALYEILVASALWSGWLALTLAELGGFSLGLHTLLTLAWSGLGLWLGRRVEPSAGPDAPARRAERLLYAVVLSIAALLMLRPFETVLGGKDAGVYANTGFAIARTGSIVQHDPIISEIIALKSSPDAELAEAAHQAETNFLSPRNRERYLATRARQTGFFSTAADLPEGRVVPQFFHLYPAWLGLFTAALGLKGGLAATGYMGLLGLWGAAIVGRRLAGPLVGALALGLLAFNTLQVWFARYTTSESTAQMLLLSGLAAFAALMALPAEERRGRRGVWYGALAGAALGQLALTRIDFFWGVGPAVLFLVYMAISRRWFRGLSAYAWLLLLMLGQATAHILLISRAYFIDTGFARFQDFASTARLVYPLLSEVLQSVFRTNSRRFPLLSPTQFWIELALLIGALLALLALWRWPRLLRTLEGWTLRGARPALGLAAVGIVLLAGYAYLVRPGILSAATLSDPAAHRLTLEGYIGAPVLLPEGMDCRYGIGLGNMVRLGWYFSPLGMLLAVAGAALWLARGTDRRSWMLLLVGLLYSAFYIRALYGTCDQHYVYILRRYVPGALPFFSLTMAYALALLIRRRSTIVRSMGMALAGLLLAFFVATGWRSFAHTEYAGALDQLAALAGRLEPNAVVLARGGGPDPLLVREVASELATPLTYAFGRDALYVSSRDPRPYVGQLARYVRHWREQGRPVYLLLGASGGDLTLPGFDLEQLGPVAFTLPEWQQLTNQKPALPTAHPVTFMLYRVVAEGAAAAPAAIAAADTAWQVRGFYPAEQQAGPPYAWIEPGATLRLPLSTDQPLTVTLTLAAGERPSTLPATQRVCLKLLDGEVELAQPQPACLDLGADPQAYQIRLPALPPGADLRFAGEAWVPLQATAGLPAEQRIIDGRALLAQFYGFQR